MHYTRRQWLASAAAAPALAGRAYRPLLGVQFFVWTQQFAREKKPLAQGMEEAFPAVARAGYRRVELMPQFWSAEVRARTRALLREHGLEPVIVYNGGLMHTPEGARETIAKTLELAAVAAEAGTRAVSFNPHPKRDRKTDVELEVQARSLDELGARLRERRMDLYIHQHAPEMAENAREWRHQLRHTDPTLVKLELDLDWVRRGGQDPLALLAEAAPRVAALHLRSMRQGVWMEEFGDGDVDFRAAAALLRRTGFRGYLMVELAYEKETVITRPLEENLRRSRLYAEKVFLQ